MVTSFAPWQLAELGAGQVGPQFFAFEETEDGWILMGNNLGLIVFDGHRTERLAGLKGRIVLSLSRGPDGTIWAGGTGAMGRLLTGPAGELVLESLSPPEAAGPPAFTDVWSVGAFSWGTMFRAPEGLFWRKPQGTWEVYRPEGSFGVGSTRIGERWFVRDTARGLLEFREGRLEPVSGGSQFASERIYGLVPYGERTYLVATRGKGLLLLDPEAPAEQAVRPFPNELSDWPERALVYCLIRSRQGFYLLGSLREGLVALDAQGRVLRRLSVEDGLREAQVLSLFEDSLGRIWVGHARGISRLGANAKLTQVPLRDSVGAGVESIARIGERLWVATNLGLYRLEPGSPAQLVLEKGSLPAMGILPLPGAAPLVTTTYDLRHGTGPTAPSLSAGVVRAFGPSGAHPGLYLAAGDGGIYGLRVGENGQVRIHRLLELDTPVTSCVEHRGIVWFNTEYQKPNVRRARWSEREVAPGFPALEGVEAVEEGGLVEAWASFLALGDRLVLAHPGAALVLEGDRFVPDSALADALGGRASRLGRVAAAIGPERWAISQGDGVWELRAVGEAGWEARPLAQLPPSGRVLELEYEEPVLWIGTDEGLYRLDLETTVPLSSPRARLRAVRAPSGRVLWAPDRRGGFPADRIPLPRGERSVRVEVFAAGFERPEQARFRIWIEPIEARPVEASRQPSRDVVQLPQGAHRLRVEVEGSGARNVSTWTLVVPPFWHELPVSRAAGAALFLLLGALGYRVRVRALRRRAQELEAEVAKRTEELREASFTDPLTGARNRRYFHEAVLPELRRVTRFSQQERLVFLLIDLDHFKKVNDTYGHAAGDAILAESARRLLRLLRGSDLLFRWGGEEFLVVARGGASLSGEQLSTRILEALGKDLYRIPDQSRRVARTASVGWIAFPFFAEDPEALTLEQMLELADRALYRAKELGRARAIGFLPKSGGERARESIRRWLASTQQPQLPAELEVVEVLGGRPASREVLLEELSGSDPPGLRENESREDSR